MNAQYEHVPTTCPRCGIVLDTSRPAEGSIDRGPVAGDISICWSCTAIMVFRDDRTLRRITVEELSRLDDEDHERLRAAVLEVRRAREAKL